MTITNLRTHSRAYVTVQELADYWLVGRKQIYKFIDCGVLPVLKLGPRLYRIDTQQARAFEGQGGMGMALERREKMS